MEEKRKKLDRIFTSIKNNRELFILLFLIFVFRVPTFYQPIFDIDESVFSEFASKMLKGGKPYIDAVDNKPLLNYYFFYIIYSIFGESLIIVHFTTTLIVMITGIFVYFIGKVLKDKKTGIFSLLSFVLLTHVYEPKYISTNGETVINLFLSISLFFLFFRKENPKYDIMKYSFIGILISISFFIRYHSLFFLIGLLFFRIIVFIVQKMGNFRIEDKLNLRARDFVFLFLGFFGFALVLIIIMVEKSFFKDFFYWTIEYNKDYIESSREIPVSRLFARILLYILSSLPVWFFVFRYSINSLLVRLKEKFLNEKFIFLVIMFILSFLTVLPGKRAYGHYFILIVLFLSLLSGLGLSLSNFKKRIIFSVFLIFPFIFTIPRIDLASFGKLFDNPYEKANIVYQKVGIYIKERTKDNDRIFCWGFASPIYYYSKRSSVSRFITADFISGRIFGTREYDLNIKRRIPEKIWVMFWDDIQKHGRPKYFIDTSPANFYSYGRLPLTIFDDLNNFVLSNYVFDSEIDKVVIYRLKD